MNSMSKPLIIANWKMNPATSSEARHLLNTIQKGLKGSNGAEVIVCPPFIWLPILGSLIKSSETFSAGGQDLFWEKQGAYTGEVSPLMLKDAGCEYVIVGHSERREFLGETDEMVNKKTRVALKNRLKPILCVGEKARDTFDSEGRVENYINPIVEDQLKKALEGVDKSRVVDIVIAYEPIWAISTSGAGEAPEPEKSSVRGKADTPDDALSAAMFIRKIIAKMFDDRRVIKKIRVIYGGSVNSKNVASFVGQEGIDGVLIGGASLNGSEFSKIVKILSH